MTNFWLERANAVTENEVLVLESSQQALRHFDDMGGTLPVIVAGGWPPLREDYQTLVGNVHHLRYTKFGIEGILKTRAKYHRRRFRLMDNPDVHPKRRFWVVVLDDARH